MRGEKTEHIDHYLLHQSVLCLSASNYRERGHETIGCHCNSVTQLKMFNDSIDRVVSKLKLQLQLKVVRNVLQNHELVIGERRSVSALQC